MRAAVADLLTRRLALQPSTLNMEAGTVDVTLSTGAPVRRAGFVERLGMEPADVNVAVRVPLLDAHRQTSIRDIKGRVENIRHEGGACQPAREVEPRSASNIDPFL